MTAPTEAMWGAMRDSSSVLGWTSYGEDPFVAQLEEECASLTGLDAGLFVATTSLANILAMMAVCRPGDQVIMEARCHLYWVEQRNVSSLAGSAPRMLDGDRFGAISIEDLSDALTEGGYGYLPHTGVIMLENTHNVCGGTVLTASYIDEVVALAETHASRVVVDGARIWNAAVSENVDVSRLTGGLDAVSMSLNKALGAPYGAMLCGSAEVIEEARYHLRTLAGHSVHRSGMFAAAALHALEDWRSQVEADHAAAWDLSQALARVPGVQIDPDTVQSNIIRIELPEDRRADDFVARLRERGVGSGVLQRNALKLVTHREFDVADIDLVVEAFEGELAQGARS